MATLIAQHEGEADEIGRTYGFEVFHDPAEDFYTTRFHIRTYDGIKVADAWATPEVRLNSTSGAACVAEAGRVLAEFKQMLNPVL